MTKLNPDQQPNINGPELLLPIDNCARKYNPLLGVTEYLAPKGRTFKIEGNLIQFGIRRSFLLKSGDPVIAVGREPDYITKVFQREDPYPGERIQHSVGSSIWTEHNSDGRRIVHLVNERRAQSLPGTEEISYEIASGSGIYQIACYGVSHHEVVWTIIESVGFDDEINVIQADGSEIKSELDLMLDSDWPTLQGLWVPDLAPSSTFYRDFAIEHMGATPEVAEQIARVQMLRSRMQGIPLNDDPMRNVKLITESGRRNSMNLLSLLEEVEAERQLPRTSEGYKQRNEAANIASILEDHANRIKGKIAIVGDNGSRSLDTLVEEHASPDWLDRELAALRDELEHDIPF